MANIVNELDDILKAIRGEDVRMSIYRGLQKINNQTISMQTLVDALDEAITGSAGERIRNLILETAANMQEYTTADSPLNVIPNDDYPYHYYMIPGTLYYSTADGYECELVFSVDLPKIFADDYTITPINVKVNCKTIIITASKAQGSTPGFLINKNIVSDSTVSAGFESCTLTPLAGTSRVVVTIVFNATGAAEMKDYLEEGDNPCFVTLSKFEFAITEVGE